MWASVENLSDPYNPRADEAIAAASHILWGLSGRKYAGSQSVVEFYDTRSGIGWLDSLQAQALFQVYGTNYTLCTDCGFPHRLRLRHQPVQRILSVELNGVAVAPTDYALLNNAILGFPYGSIACGATCARVSYIWGVNPPAGGRAAAASLANQFLLAWDGDDTCKFPKRVTSVTRQGVSWTILDPQDFLDDGRTGIYEIDLFLKTVNPDKARRPARVFSPDIPRASTIIQEISPPAVSLTPLDLGVISPGDPAWYIVPAATWIGGAYTPLAVINGVEYDDEHFTTNLDGSLTFVLSSAETMTLVENDPFVIKARPNTPGADITLSSGYVRFVQA